MGLNLGIFDGRLGKDAELKHLQSGTVVLNFSIANESGWGDHKKVHWIDCALWGKRAETLAQYLKKGKMVTVHGEVDLQAWTGKDGVAAAKMRVNCNHVVLYDGGDQDGQQQPPSGSAQHQAPTAPQNFSAGGAMIPDDVPF